MRVTLFGGGQVLFTLARQTRKVWVKHVSCGS
jgi:hypothetical protein